MSGDLVNACIINTVCHTHVPTGQKVILLQKESVARGNPVCCLSHRVMGSKKIYEKPIQNEWRLKVCAQSGSGERKLTQTDPIKKK